MMLSVVVLLAAAQCVASSNAMNMELRSDFEARACQNVEGLLRADMVETGDMLEITMTVDAARETLPSGVPFRIVEAANIAQRVLDFIRTSFAVNPATFQWTVQDKHEKYICTVRVEGEEVSGDCGGAGQP